jgi:hypothetical protein
LYKEYLKGCKDRGKSIRPLVDQLEKLLINSVRFSKDSQTIPISSFQTWAPSLKKTGKYP